MRHLQEKKVIHVYGGSPKKRGSLEEYFLLLTRQLRDQGWRSVFCFDRPPTGELLQAYLDSGAELRTVRTTLSRFDVPLIRQFRMLFRQEHATAVNVHFGATSINGLIAAWTAGIRKRIWTKHSLDAISYKGKPSWHKQWLHTINYQALWATDIVAVSQAVKKELADHWVTDKVRQFYLGVDRRRFASGTNADAILKSLGIPDNRRVISCISQARPEKGLEFLVRAISLLKQDKNCPYVVIVGGGPLTGVLEKLAAELDVSSLVKFCGVRNDVEDILALSSFSVLPSLEDAAPLALMESLAAGKPVVATRVGGIPEFVRHDVNGILVNSGDAAGLASGISSLCADKQRLSRLSEGAKKSSELLDVRYGVKQTISLYSEDIE